MSYLKIILTFGWSYLRRYWVRLVLGVLLGVLFGVSNAAVLGATKTLLSRLDPTAESALVTSDAQSEDISNAPPSSPVSGLRQRLNEWRTGFQQLLDSWLPVHGRPLDPRQIAGVILLFPLLMAGRGTIGYLSSYCLGWVSERVINDLRLDVLIKLNSLSLDYFNRSKTGDLLTRVNGDTAALHRALNRGLSDLIKEPVTVLAVFAYLCYLDWQLTLFLFVFFPLCVIPVVVLGRKVRRASQGNVKATISQSSLLVELLSSIRIVKAFNLENNQIQRFRKLCRELVHHGMKNIQAKELVNPILETLAALGMGILIVVIFATNRNLTDMVIFLAGVMTVYTPIKKLSAIHVIFQKASVGVERLEAILKEQPTVREPAAPKTLTRFESAIHFDRVGFAYDTQPVLEQIHLTVPHGMKLGVAGESGSGKSTLVNLMFRFYDPTEGAIRIDGVDLREITTANLRELMALVSQETVLFDQTVANNIACGKPGASRQEVEAAARAAYAHEFIRKLPEGYDTFIGERGVSLSGGQRQRLAIARAFIRDAPILVLDEATASLDSQSEAEVQSAIDRLSENRTVISVAHRLSTLARMDHIIVVFQGRIIEEGGYTELLTRGGAFAAMARRQGIKTQEKVNIEDRG